MPGSAFKLDIHRSAGGHELQPSDVNSSTTGAAVGPLCTLQLAGAAAACASEAASESPVASKEVGRMRWSCIETGSALVVPRRRFLRARPCATLRARFQ